MGRFGIPRISYLKKVFFFTHLMGLGAGALIPMAASPLIGPPAGRPSFVLLCLGVGFGVGAASFLFVRGTLKRQLDLQMSLLRPLTGRETAARAETVEGMVEEVEVAVAKVEDLVKTILVTVDQLLPHHAKLTQGANYLAERARVGLAAATEFREVVAGMEAKFREVMSKMALLADRTQDEAALSRQLSASLEEMAGAMDHSTSKFLETTSAVEEMAASVREVAAQAGEVGRSVEGAAHDLDTIGEALEKMRKGAEAGSKASGAVREDAERGLTVVKSSMAEMERIETESRKASQAMERLSRQTGEVETIVAVIKDLVSDTELLAFNAAIIAAQAGEEGKGFSVVADEIRDLADRTAASAGDIHKIIQAIGHETRQVTGAVEATVRRIVEGRRIFESTGEALRKIVGSSGEAAEASREIARLTEREGGRARGQLEEAGRSLRAVQSIVRAMKEQETGVYRIQEGVEEMKAAADRIARGMEEQVKANSSFDQGLEERESQAQAVSAATRYLMGVAEQVVAHFHGSQERLQGNVEKAQVLSSEVGELEELTGQMRRLVDGVNRQVTPGP